jgi:tetratricopeptide (TPR) repeat protein
MLVWRFWALWCAVVAVGLLSVPLHARMQPEAEDWSIEMSLEAEQTPAERIRALNRQIMDLRARGVRAAELGDLYNDLGVLHARQEEWAQARDAFIHAVQAKPSDPDFHRNLGLVFQKLGDLDLAISEFQVFHDLTGGLAKDASRLLAQAHLENGDIESARRHYRQGLQDLGRVPGPALCRLALGLARLEREHGEPAAARQVLETWYPSARAWREKAEAEGEVEGVQEAIAIENTLLSIFIQDGQLLEDAGLLQESLELYEKAYAIAPQRDDLLPRIVSAYLATGDIFQARVRVRLARQNHPDRIGTWLAAAKIHEAEDQLQPALEAYERAYALAPETPGLRLLIGNLHMKLGRSDEARTYLAMVIEDEDTPTEVIYNYAISLMREQLYAAAAPLLLRVTRENPEFAGGWLALAQTFRAREQYTRAVEAYRKVLALQPDVRSAYNLGVTAGQAGMWDTAVTAYEHALELDPGHRESAYNRAVALMRADRLDEADAAFAAYLKQDPEHYRANLNHGVTLFRLGRYEQAIDVYGFLLEIQETAEVWDNMGLAYQGLGESKRAERCFLEAKKMRGGS